MNHFVFCRGQRAAATARTIVRRIGPRDLPLKVFAEQPEETLLIRDGLVGAHATHHAVDPENFVVASGMFFFDGQFGRDALASFFAGLDVERPSLAGTRGQFCVLARKAGRTLCFTDALGCGKIYHTPDVSVVASAFIGVAESLDAVTLDEQGCYEYAWAHVPSGDKTFLREVRALPAGQALRLDGSPRLVALPALDLFEPDAVDEAPKRLVDRHVQRARDSFALYARTFGDRLSISLSGGYDSRLALALALDAGVRPHVFTFRVAGLQDHHVAEHIAGKENLELEIVEKSIEETIPLEAFPDHVDGNYCRFDGWKVDGLFDDGVDAADRQARVGDGRVKVNGGLGEIYRNFFYLPDGRYALREVVWSFFSQYAPSACTPLFSPKAYETAIGAEIARAIGAAGPHLDRAHVEAVYPLFRGRFWTAREISLNQYFGPCLFPFLEPVMIKGTPNIPIALKSYGIFEGRMIRAIHPALAAYPTNYGFSFAADPPRSYILKSQLTYRRPPLLRRYAYRIKRRTAAPRPYYLGADYLTSVLDVGFPYLRQVFHIDKINDANVFNRIATMEYVCQRVAGHGRRR